MRTVTFSDKAVVKALNKDFVCTWHNRNKSFHDCARETESILFVAAKAAFATRNISTFFLTEDLQVLHYVAGYYSPSLFEEEVRFAVSLRDALFDKKGKLRPDAAKIYKKRHAKRAGEMKSILEALVDVRGSALENSDSEYVERLAKKVSALKYEGGGEFGKYTDMMDELELLDPEFLSEAIKHLVEVHKDLAGKAGGHRRAHALEIESKETLLRDRPPCGENMESTASKPPKQVRGQERERIKGIPLFSRLKESYLFGNDFTEEKTKESRAPTEVQKEPDAGTE